MAEHGGLAFDQLFFMADPIVKAVMIMLVLASLFCWTIILEKSVRLMMARRQARRFESDAAASDRPAASGRVAQAIVHAGLGAAEDRDMQESRAERRERIERAMRAAMTGELRRLEMGLPFLATVGSAAPFIGLFGTVWGIMNSFTSIAASGDTSLAVVAPGIAEALFATALGLVAAIPAVVAYNKLTTDLGRLSQRLVGGIGALGNRLARDRAEPVVTGRAA
ncbi:MotA/TolQ/ExbB proton channel family protein [Marinivivus vitaminiproducens]|uniref:MotA/TolQ/ExbB proton channel family protein n=1 Tax=Marinivivus vitaminiproducens TaxID=3035935 RepID=UPI0027A33DC0|nr:MotA/TolQ/ExbB proton channel family protein [Geminicoccaceae bacterium SCSIO 64248]